MIIEKPPNQKSEVQVILNNRQLIESEVDRIFKKSYGLKRNSAMEKQIIDFIFNNLPYIINNLNKNIDTKQIDILYSRSKEDLEIAKMAYDKEIYWASVYHLQQAIEKAAKAYGLSLGIIENPKDEIRHITPEVYLKLLRPRWVEDFSKIFIPDINLEKNINNLSDLVRTKKKNEAEILANILDLDNNIPSIIVTYEKMLKNMNKSFSRPDIKVIVKETKKRCGMDIKYLYISQARFTILYLFSFITLHYAVEPRYSGEFDKLNIIKYFDKITKLINKSFEDMHIELHKQAGK